MSSVAARSHLRGSMLILTLPVVTGLAAPLSRMIEQLAHLDRAVSEFKSGSTDCAPVMEACQNICRQLADCKDHSSQTADDAVDDRPPKGLLEQSFAELNLDDVLLNALAVADQKGNVEEVACAVAASVRFASRSSLEREAALDALQAALTDDVLIDARRHVLEDARAQRKRDAAPTEADDEDIMAALLACMAQHLKRIRPMASLGFPASPLGLLCFTAADRATGSSRAAASMGRFCGHAADGLAPLILLRNAACRGESEEGAPARSLVIAFSSLGWHGLVRAEWLGALRAAAATSSEERSASKRPNFDVAHCLDTARSWFTTDPISGEYDDGQWWNAKLAELCMEYDEVSLVGESMGATAALRFASHATASGSVIALVPQVDLRDFECCARLDFDDEAKIRLRDAIADACATTHTEVTVHVGRDTDDLHQLNHVPALAALYEDSDEEVDEPLPRDGMTVYRSAGSGLLRCIKHDVESHNLGAGLRAAGRPLHLAVLESVFAPSKPAATGSRATSAASIAAPDDPTGIIRVCSSAADRAGSTPVAFSVEVGSELVESGGLRPWALEAAACLEAHGFCILSSADGAAPLVSSEICAACSEAASERLEDLLCRVERRGVDRSDEFRFAELVHRDGLRYDMPLAWRLERGSEGGADGVFVSPQVISAGGGLDAAFGRLHEAADAVARSALAAVAARGRVEDELESQHCDLWSIRSSPIAGCVTSVPSASAQSWHSDGGEPGMFNVFVPLVDLTRSNGPTELQPGSHRLDLAEAAPGLDEQGEGDERSWVAPLLKAGDILIFDYRIRHRGLPNDSTSNRPVAYMAYALGEARDSNFPAAATLQWD